MLQRLGQPPRVPDQLVRDLGIDGDAEIELLARRLCRAAGRQPVQHFSQQEAAGLQLQPAAVEAGVIEHVDDDVVQLLAGRLDLQQTVLLPG